MSSDAPIPLPRTQFTTSRVDINGTSNRPTATPGQNVMTPQRTIPTGVTSQDSSQSADAVRMLDGK